MDFSKFLPEEMKLVILTRLPTETVLDCTLVSKKWRSLVGNPSFTKMHVNQVNHPDNDSGELSFFVLTCDLEENTPGEFTVSIPKYHFLEYNEKHESTLPIERIRRIHSTFPFICFVGSLNGLICVTGEQYHEPAICIFNPVIKEYVMLPEIKPDYSDIKTIWWTTGFGYVSETNEYKVVRIYRTMTKVVQVCIYTLGRGNGWRYIGDFDPSFRPYHSRPGIFANGALHWMDAHLAVIVTFDLAEEKFCQHLSPPPLPPNVSWSLNRIGVCGEFLFYAIYLVVEGNSYYEIWQQKKKKDNHGIKEGEEHLSLGWSKVSRVDYNELFTVTKNGGVLTYIDNHLDIYDAKALTSKRLVEFKEQILKVFLHKNTLVSLKVLGEDDTKIMDSIETEETESHDQPLEQL